MYSDLIINVQKMDHDLNDREKMLLNLLFTQAMISINDHITQVPLGLHQKDIMHEDLLHHHIAFTSEVDHDTMENLKEAFSAGISSILQTCGIEDFNINYN